MNNLFINRVTDAIDLLCQYEPKQGYHVAFSGGKDSVVLADLCKKAGVKYKLHYMNTTIDPPELVRFIMKNYPDCKFIRPLRPFSEVIKEKQYPPTRVVRYCCQVLKEHYQPNGIILMGIRKKESWKRSKRSMFELLHKSGTFVINPIIYWEDFEVWEYIGEHKLPYCLLYDEGYKRLGCVMCPQAGSSNMKKDAKRFPRIAKRWLMYFNKMYDYQVNVNGKDYRHWKSGQDVYDWWINTSAKNSDKETLSLLKNEVGKEIAELKKVDEVEGVKEGLQ